MLLISSLVATIVVGLTFSTTTESFEDSYYGKKDFHKIHNSLATLVKSKNLSRYNVASDKEERTLVMPKITYDVGGKKQRKIKKAPRAMVQKIIKKSKKSRKTFYEVTKLPTEQTPYETMETTSTTQTTKRKKIKKWNSKYARYPMPFQKLSARKDLTMHRKNRKDVNRYRREVDRDVYILEDFDQIEFLSDEKNNENTIKAHVKKYW